MKLSLSENCARHALNFKVWIWPIWYFPISRETSYGAVCKNKLWVTTNVWHLIFETKIESKPEWNLTIVKDWTTLKIEIELKKVSWWRFLPKWSGCHREYYHVLKEREVLRSQIGHLTVVHPISLFLAGITRGFKLL